MTEPENLEDDLFADLYNDDEPAPQPQAAPDHSSAAAQPPAADDSYDPAQQSNQQYDDQNGQDQYMNQGDAGEEEDDDVDFNLGNGNSIAHHDQDQDQDHGNGPQGYGIPQQQHHGHRGGPNSKEDGKMFIGGLNWETTDQSLRDYFSQFGEVIECTVMRDGTTGRSRGFGFLTFKDPKTVNTVMVKEHYLDGKIIDPKRAIPRDEQEKTSKIFVGGVSQETTDHEFREYFARFGRVVDATLMMDKDTGRPRGFGFVTFESDSGVEACLAANLEIHGKAIEVKKAQPRGNMREEEEAAARRGQGKFGRKGDRNGSTGGQGLDDGSGGMGGGMGAGGAPGGMTPQVMAQYWQRMQQYFAMMQQQMAMNRGAMNPAMMQMMQMQQMQQQMMLQGRGQAAGGANPMAAMGQMNPAMMQQMQQMMAQQQGQQGGQQGGSMPAVASVGGGGMSPMGNASGAGAGSMSPAPQGGAAGGSQHGGSNSGGGGGANKAGAGFNGFEQQQQYEQQQVQQQQQRRGGNNNYRDQQQQAFGGGQGGYGGPTNWEGMYDDVPQPMVNQGGGGGHMGGGGGGGRGGYHKNRGAYQQQHNQNMMPVDPNAAPPPNAPTGPKNAGRPGANYRGGGRGGNRGFHPYSRG